MQLFDIISLLISQVLSVPAVLMGLIALFGLALSGKSVSETFVGTLKTMFGIIILNLGVGAIVNATLPLSNVMNAAFKVHGIIPDGTLGLIYGMLTPINFPMTFSFVLALSLVLQLVIARFTPLKCIHLTGHILLGWSFNFTLICFAFGLRDIPLIVVASIMAAFYFTGMPWIVHRWDKDWIPDAGFTLGHDEYLAIIFGCTVGPYIGDPEKESCEKLQLPGWLSVFQDNTISSTLVMLVLWISMVLLAGQSAVTAYTGGQYWLIWAVMQAITFTAGIMVVLFGVRIFVGQIMPAFTGISRRVVPGAIPALDCPTVYPFGPQAVLVGYIAYLVGEVSATLTQLAIGYPYVSFPGVWLFFAGSTIGVYTDKEGGWKAVLVVCLITGYLAVWASSLYFPLLPQVLRQYGNTASDTDHSYILTPFLYLAKLFGYNPG